MAEIKFTIERMKEVHNSIGDIITQLESSISSSNDLLGTISSNVQSDNIKNTVANYIDKSNERVVSTKANLQQLDEYLVAKIQEYSTINQTAVDSFSEVRNLLDQLNI